MTRPSGGKARTPARSSATVAVWTLVSRATGLLRVVVIGAVLGPTYLANVFLSTNVVPNVVYTFVAGPAVGMVVVPAVVRALTDRSRLDAGLLLGRVTGYLVGVASMIAAALLLASPAIGWLLTAGVPEGRERERALWLVILMLVFVAPQVVLYAVAGVGVAAQQVCHRFALAAAAPAAENIGLIATVLAVGAIYPAGLEVDTAPASMMIMLGVGSTVAVGLHAGIQLVGAARAGLAVRPRAGWRHDETSVATTKRMRGSVSVAGFPALAYFLRLGVSATVPGGVFVLQVAYSIYNVPSALGARAVSIAVLPGLSREAADGDEARFAASWRQALCYVVNAGLPAALLLVAFAAPAAEVFTAGEAHTATVAAALAGCIAVLGVAQVAGGVHEIGRQALFARLDVTGPRRASAALLVATLVVCAAALAAPAGVPRLVVLGLSVLAGDLFAAVYVVRRLARTIRPEPALDGPGLAMACAAAAVMMPLLVAGWFAGATLSGQVVALVGALGGLAAAALAAFAAALHLLGRRWPRSAP